MSGWLPSVYFKVTLCALIICVGVTGGIYLGFAVTRTKGNQYQPPRIREVSEPISWVNFGSGDAFPLEPFTLPDGRPGSFDSLLKDRESIVVFADWSCGPCLDLLRYIQTNMLGRLTRGTQIVLITDISIGGPPEEYRGYVDELVWVQVDGDNWRSTYHTAFRPIIVGIDDSGIVLHVQFGYDGFVDHELVDRFFRTRD